LEGRPQGSARPEVLATPQNDTPMVFTTSAESTLSGTCAPTNAGLPTTSSPRPSVSAGPRLARDLDAVLFTAPFVVIGADNKAIPGGACGSYGEALVKLRHSRIGVAIVGTLVDGAHVVDVDLKAGADPMLGDAAAESLVAWCVEHDVRYTVRQSGRAGHWHVIVLLGSDVELLAELRRRCAGLARQLDGTEYDVRRPLRLLSTPHRLGLPTRLLGGTLRPEHVAELVHQPGRAGVDRVVQADGARTAAAMSQRPDQGVSRPGETANDEDAVLRDDSASAREFGALLAMLRAGWSTTRAWKMAGSCQVVDRGRADWERYLLLPALTIVSAEQGLDEARTWERLERECPAAARQVTRDAWEYRWQRAVAEAATDRPRRYWLPRYAGDQGTHADQALDAVTRHRRRADIDVVFEAVWTAAERELGKQGRRPQVYESMRAYLYAVVVAIVTGGGRISMRRAAVEACLSDSTVEKRRSEALCAGLLRRVATYQDDRQNTDVYALGPAAQHLVDQARETRGRSCTPPLPRPLGQADPDRLRQRHQAQRAGWPPPVLSSACTERIRKIYPSKGEHGASVILSRSRHWQWWDSLHPHDQEERREMCRRRLDAMSYTDRLTWTTWLATRRWLVDQPIRDLLDGVEVEPARLDGLATAPMTIHHGRQDPFWRVGGTRPRTASIGPQRLVQGASGTNSPTGESIELQLDVVGVVATAAAGRPAEVAR